MSARRKSCTARPVGRLKQLTCKFCIATGLSTTITIEIFFDTLRTQQFAFEQSQAFPAALAPASLTHAKAAISAHRMTATQDYSFKVIDHRLPP